MQSTKKSWNGQTDKVSYRADVSLFKAKKDNMQEHKENHETFKKGL